MNENLSVKVLKLTADGDLAYLNELSYHAYIKSSGLTVWLSLGEIVGTSGSGRAVQVIEVKMD